MLIPIFDMTLSSPLVSDPKILFRPMRISLAVAFSLLASLVVALTLLPSMAARFALIGAAITSVVVYALGSIGPGGATPVRLALAGAALSALLFALTRAVTLLDTATLDQFRFWAVGSLSGRGPPAPSRSATPAQPLRTSGKPSSPF